MLRKRSCFVAAIALMTAFILPMACNSDDEETPVTPSNPLPRGENLFIIGNHTDLTGVSSQATGMINMALNDMKDYFNEANLIPGVKLDVISYDGQYDPSRDLPGYEWLLERGADAIFSPVAATAITLKPRLRGDGVVMFTVAPPPEAIYPPDWVFATGQTLIDYAIYTLLSWLPENDPDFPRGRPARIGAAFWNEAYGEACLRSAQAYAEAHPEQYEWVSGHLTNFTYTWGPEAAALKDCDYVMPPVPMTNFVKEYRESGYTGKFLGTDAQAAFLGLLDDAGLWNEADGMLLIRVARWWNDEGEVIDLSKRLLHDKHGANAERIIRSGNGYLSTQQMSVIFALLDHTVNLVGAENLSSPAIFEAAQSFSMTLDGCPHSFTPEKRVSNDGLAVYELNGTIKDVVRVHTEWLPVVYEP